MLEVNVEESQDLKSAAAAPAPGAPAATAPAPGLPAAKPATLLGAKAPLDIEADKPLKVVKLPQDKKSKISSFVGSWSFKDMRGGDEIVIQAFEIAVNDKGEMSVIPPKRLADNIATVTAFEVTEKTLKLQLKWKMKSVPAYWKTETYDLTMSEDGKTLAGSYNQQSVGGRNVYVDKDLFRQ
jgi:hypothetical protein